MAEIKKPAKVKGYQGKNFDSNFDHAREERKAKGKQAKNGSLHSSPGNTRAD